MASPPHVLLIKEKGVAPTRSSTTVYQVFAFQNKMELFNYFFRHNMMNRFQVETKIGDTPYAGMSQLLDVWAKSRYPDDTLCESTLPMPNTKDYVWRNTDVNKTIQDERWKLTNDRSRGRKRMDLHQLQVKGDMFHDLISAPCFVLEMREDTLNTAMKKGGIKFTHQFVLERKLNQSSIDRTDMTTQRTDLDFIGALEAFSCMRVSFCHSSLKKRSRSQSSLSLDDEYEDDEEEGEEEVDCPPIFSSTSPTSSVKSSLSIREHPTPYRRTNPKRQATEKQGISLFFFLFLYFIISFFSISLFLDLSPSLSGFMIASRGYTMEPSPLKRNIAITGNIVTLSSFLPLA